MARLLVIEDEELLGETLVDGLEIPEATVRTQLLRARRRLKKELFDMDDTDFKVLYAEAQRDHLNHQPVAESLARARAAFDSRRATGELDFETVRLGEKLLFWQGEKAERVRLLEEFLRVCRDPTERYWGEVNRIHALDDAERHDEAVAGHEALLRTLASPPAGLALNLDRSPWKEGEVRLPGDSLALAVHLDACSRESWKAVGRGEEYREIFRRLLDATPKHAENRWLRFYALRWLFVSLEEAGYSEEGEEVVERIEALAEEEQHPFDAAHWRAQAAAQRLRPSSLGSLLRAEAALAALAEAENRLPPGDAFRQQKFHILRNNTGSSIADIGLFALAEPILRADAAGPSANGYTFGRLAGCVWAQTGDRKATLALIRKGQGMEPRERFWDWLRKRPEFQSVADDPQFLDAGTP